MTKENFKYAQVVEGQRWLNVRYMLKVYIKGRCAYKEVLV